MSALNADLDWITLARHSGYQRQALAKLCGVSSGHLNKYFVAHYSRPPQDWLDEIRMWDAFRLLCQGSSVKSVTYSLGFKQVSHFSRVFHIYHGFSPSDCRTRYFTIERKLREACPIPDCGDELPATWRVSSPWNQALQNLTPRELAA